MCIIMHVFILVFVHDVCMSGKLFFLDHKYLNVHVLDTLKSDLVTQRSVIIYMTIKLFGGFKHKIKNMQYNNLIIVIIVIIIDLFSIVVNNL